jgi:hypothetical protein
MSELSKLIDSLVEDLERVLVAPSEDARALIKEEYLQNGETLIYKYREESRDWEEITTEELDRIIGEKTLMEQDRQRGEDRAEQLQAVIDSARSRKQVLQEEGLDTDAVRDSKEDFLHARGQMRQALGLKHIGENVEEQVKPLAQALAQAENLRVSIPLPDRERLVALLHSQARLTDERVEDIACVLSDAQPVPTDLRPLLQDNLKALARALYWLRECLRDTDDQLIKQHMSQGLELIQTQMGKTERALEEDKDEQ